jgi:hypothetical protein
MNEVIILRSPYLIQREGKAASASGYKYSHHQKGIETLEEGLREINIPYVIWDEDEFRAKESIFKRQSSKIILAT